MPLIELPTCHENASPMPPALINTNLIQLAAPWSEGVTKIMFSDKVWIYYPGDLASFLSRVREPAAINAIREAIDEQG